MPTPHPLQDIAAPLDPREHWRRGGSIDWPALRDASLFAGPRPTDLSTSAQSLSTMVLGGAGALAGVLACALIVADPMGKWLGMGAGLCLGAWAGNHLWRMARAAADAALAAARQSWMGQLDPATESREQAEEMARAAWDALPRSSPVALPLCAEFLCLCSHGAPGLAAAPSKAGMAALRWCSALARKGAQTLPESSRDPLDGLSDAQVEALWRRVYPEAAALADAREIGEATGAARGVPAKARRL